MNVLPRRPRLTYRTALLHAIFAIVSVETLAAKELLWPGEVRTVLEQNDKSEHAIKNLGCSESDQDGNLGPGL